jgi:hypothetical protein
MYWLFAATLAMLVVALHQIEFWKLDDPHDDSNIIFGITHFAPNGFNLTQEDVNALHAFLGEYVK